MSEDHLSDDQSHYEVSLTAGQAFVAFVFLLLSLAASFAFGLMIGRGQGDERAGLREKPAVITEMTGAAKKSEKLVEDPATAFAASPAPTITEEPVKATPHVPVVPHYAQILSSSDQKAAENLAAKLIERGFSSAYVERGTTDKGAVFRVRVRFPSEEEARAAEPKLKEFSKEVWITKQ